MGGYRRRSICAVREHSAKEAYSADWVIESRDARTASPHLSSTRSRLLRRILRRAIRRDRRCFRVAPSVRPGRRSVPDRFCLFAERASCACLIRSACSCRSLAMSWPIWGCDGNMCWLLSSIATGGSLPTSLNLGAQGFVEKCGLRLKECSKARLPSRAL